MKLITPEKPYRITLPFDAYIFYEDAARRLCRPVEAVIADTLINHATDSKTVLVLRDG